MTKKIREIIGLLEDANVDNTDLLALNRWIVERLKIERKEILQDKKQKLQVGMKVKWVNKNGIVRAGVILKINRTRALIDTHDFMKWNVPMIMLEITD